MAAKPIAIGRAFDGFRFALPILPATYLAMIKP